MRSRENQKIRVDGPAGQLEVVVTDPGEDRNGYAIIAHPHPLHGGTLDNKVVYLTAKRLMEDARKYVGSVYRYLEIQTQER